MRTALVVSTLVALAAHSSFALASEAREELVITAPIESADASSGKISVLGQQIRVDAAANFSVGSIVNVYSRSNGSANSSAQLHVESLGSYSSGADSLFVRGRITATSHHIGQVSIGTTRIDYTALMAVAGFRLPAAGEFVVVHGTQPQLGGPLLATHIAYGNSASEQGIIGSGAQSSGIIGSGVQHTGIIGSGAQSSGIIGSGVQHTGIIGSGAQHTGIIGSGAHSAGIIGSGSAS